jgi:hypothetical protein
MRCVTLRLATTRLLSAKEPSDSYSVTGSQRSHALTSTNHRFAATEMELGTGDCMGL